MNQPISIPTTGVSHFLTAWRKRAGLTQEGLADKAGISPSTVFNYESEKTIPDARTWAILVQILEIPGWDSDSHRIWLQND